MKVFHITAILIGVHLSLSAFSVQAADALTSVPLTRAEVGAELLRARVAGELPSPADLYGPTLSRALLESRRGSGTRLAGENATVAPATNPMSSAASAK